ncbi:MAG: GntR family transcriptional regulator [Chryseobacterium sp.]|nr:MAG: GntR family transcriptional regulator [Chryseobacterium sp.]
MKAKTWIEEIELDNNSGIPKYLQLSSFFISAIDAGHIGKGMILPSLNEVSSVINVSRCTVEKSYRYLKKIKVIQSSRGKGYFVAIDYGITKKVCLLFNKLSAHKKIIYDSFKSSFENDVQIDFFIYDNQVERMIDILGNKADTYTHYVIIPHFSSNHKIAEQAINKIPKEKLILLDKKLTGVEGSFGAVFEDFELDIYNTFNKAKVQLSKYATLVMVFPINSYYPEEIIKGFVLFCRQFNFNYRIIDSLESDEIMKGSLYVTVMEEDLIVLLEKVFTTDLVIGKDIGLISYNETPIKKILVNGITTISTDFELLGRSAAELVLDNSKRHIKIPVTLIQRNFI